MISLITNAISSFAGEPAEKTSLHPLFGSDEILAQFLNQQGETDAMRLSDYPGAELPFHEFWQIIKDYLSPRILEALVGEYGPDEQNHALTILFMCRKFPMGVNPSDEWMTLIDLIEKFNGEFALFARQATDLPLLKKVWLDLSKVWQQNPDKALELANRFGQMMAEEA